MPRTAKASQTVRGRNAVPRTPGEPDPDRVEPAKNAGKETEARADTADEVAEKAHAAEVAAVHASVPQPKRTEGLRGARDEQMSAMQAQLDAMQRSQDALMAANRALLAVNRSHAQDAPGAPELPTEAAVLKRQADGELTGPTLTKSGWVVPRVSAANPEQQNLTATALADALTKAAKKN